MEEATVAANAVGQVLVERHGSASWILQVMEAVQRAVDQGVRQLSGAGVVANAAPLGQPGSQYAYPARTAAEVQASAPAHQGHNAAPQQFDPRAAQAPADMFAHLSQAADPAAQHLGQPSHVPPAQSVQVPQTTPGGLVLPAGVQAPAQPAQQEAPGADGDGGVSWMF